MSVLKESFNNLKRHRFLNLASIVSISLILLIFNVLLTVNSITREQITNLSDKINLNIYLKNEASESDITQIETFLGNLSEVESVKQINKDEALKLLETKYPESSEFLNEFNIDNPLPNSIQVKTNNLEDQTQVLKILEKSNYQGLILKSENKQEYNQTISQVVQNLIGIKNFSFQIILWVLITFVIAGSLIMFNAIKTTLFTRRSEIQIMQYVGATFKRIMMPFIIEGTLIGALGFMGSLLLTVILNGFLPFNGFTALNHISILFLELVIACSIGITTSAYIVHKYLNTREIFND